MPAIRMERINEEVKKAVSEVIRDELNDPQIASVTSVTSVEVTRDLRFAKIMISIYDTENQQTRTISTLNRAAGFIAREASKRVQLRRMPQLTFKLDTNIEYGIRMSQFIDSVIGKDNESGNNHSEN